MFFFLLAQIQGSNFKAFMEGSDSCKVYICNPRPIFSPSLFILFTLAQLYHMIPYLL